MRDILKAVWEHLKREYPHRISYTDVGDGAVIEVFSREGQTFEHGHGYVNYAVGDDVFSVMSYVKPIGRSELAQINVADPQLLEKICAHLFVRQTSS
jgi:hypothetical protein